MSDNVNNLKDLLRLARDTYEGSRIPLGSELEFIISETENAIETIESQQATISKLRENNAELVDAVEQLFDQTSGESYAWVEPLLAKHNTTDGGEG